MNEQLIGLIRDARRRWRLRLALRGAAMLAAIALATVLAATWSMDALRFTPLSVLLFPIVGWVIVAYVAWQALGRALRRRASDAQVALYLEEHEPALEGRLLAAVQFAAGDEQQVSRALVDRVVADAVRTCEVQPAWRGIERRGIAVAGSVLGATLLASLMLVVVRPGFLAKGAPFMLPRSSADRPYSIGVEPGDTVIARGADLEASAQLRGFTAGQVELVMRQAGEDVWERAPMVLDSATGRYGALVLDVRANLEYLVEADGVRSRVFAVRAADIPWVEHIAVEYHFPAYTGLGPERQTGGDLAAIAGTRALVRVRPTLAVPAGTLIAYDRDTVALLPDTGGTLRATVMIRANGEYRLLFRGPDGRLAAGSPSYSIDVLPDQPPVVTLTKPGRDADATSVDEVFLEARATDDIGVRRLELVYRVNGGPERTVRLFDGARREVVAGHTVYLEELNLKVGDVIAYYALARDGRPDTAQSLSDLYFLTIRPFDRAFREAEQNGMPGQQQVDAGELSERQRQIVAATFRVVKDRPIAGETRFREDLATLTLAQGRLRGDVETLLLRLRSRGVASRDTAMGQIAAVLDSAIPAMRGAESELGRRAAQEALTPEQQALTWLQRAEALFNQEQQVARGNPQGGGGGSARSQELADLFELELDRMRNQYEEIQQEQRSQEDAQVDSTLERLRELARRQQAAEQAGGGGRERALATEAEEMARQLERLSRERQDRALADAAQQLRDAAQQMRRSSAAQGGSQGSATDRLREAQQSLERGQSSGLRRGVEQAQQRAERLRQQQAQNSQDLNSPDSSAAGRASATKRLQERKTVMAQEVGALEAELERLGRDAQADQPQASQRLRDAARGLREGRVEDKIEYSRQLAGRAREAARSFDEQISADLDSLGQRVAAAANAIGESREEKVAQALERARDAASGLESAAERADGQDGRGGRGGRGSQAGARSGQQGGQPNGQRQLGNAIREQTRQLREAREMLRREGVNTDGLDNLLGQLGRADATGAFGSPRGMDLLSQVIVPGLREYEFGVRRSITGAANLPRTAGEGNVPEGYRKMVSDYYRALAEPRP
jgi:hypothetical protein